MFQSRKIGFSLAVVLGLMMTAPVMADEACNQAINHINQATATLSSLQELRDQINQRQTSLASTGGAEASEPYKCPACGMMMPTKPTGNLTKAVKYGGKTFYCCKGCDMSATADK